MSKKKEERYPKVCVRKYGCRSCTVQRFSSSYGTLLSEEIEAEFLEYRNACLYTMKKLYLKSLGLRYILPMVLYFSFAGGLRTLIGFLLSTGNLIQLSFWTLVVPSYIKGVKEKQKVAYSI